MNLNDKSVKIAGKTYIIIIIIIIIIMEQTLIFDSAPLMIIFVGLKMQVGYIQIILSDHVNLKIRNTYNKLDFSVTRPG